MGSARGQFGSLVGAWRREAGSFYPLLFELALLVLIGSFGAGFYESLHLLGPPPISADATILGRALVDRGDYAGAVEEFRLAAAIDPERYDPPPELALTPSAGVDPEALAQRARDELAARPENPEAHLALGNALLLQGNDGSALGSLERARELDPDLPGLNEVIGLVLYRLGRLDEAARAFAEARRSPNRGTRP